MDIRMIVMIGVGALALFGLLALVLFQLCKSGR